MTSKGQHIITYDWMLDAVGSGRECYLYALLFAMANEDGLVQMSRAYMSYRLRCVVDKIDYDLKKLQEAGHIRKATIGGNGRADATTYEVLTLEGEIYPSKKGVKNNPLKRKIEGEKYPSFRGSKITPNNNINNNNSPALQESNTHTHEGMEDYGFSTFWELFKPAAEFTNLRRACCQAWAEATEPQREQILAELRRNEPHRQNPLYHIRYFGENRASADAPELLTMQQVYARFNTTEPKGWCVLELDFEAPDKARWCKIEDAERKGYPIRRKWA